MLNWSSRRNTNPVALVGAMMTGAMIGTVGLVAIVHLLGHSVLSLLLVVMF